MSAILPPMPHLDMDLIRTFVAICETGNFSRAAERVNRTPSAVSLQVKKLETLVGRALFQRESRSVMLTHDGERLLGYARQILKLNDAAIAQFLAPPMEGIVRFGAPLDSGVVAVPAILQRFAATHPHVQVDVRLDTGDALFARCKDGGLDVAVLSRESAPHGPLQPIHREPLVWVGRKHGQAVHQDPIPLALADPGCSWRAMAVAALDKIGRPYRVAYFSEHCQGQAAAVEADLAVAPLPLSVVKPPLAVLGEEQGLPPLGDFAMRIMVRPEAGAVAEALAEHVTQSYRDMADQGLRLFA
ncbi:MAG: LysR family transcriptional regulator [Rhodospirillaceae bacterium]